MFWATVEGATEYGDDRTRPAYAAAYENGGRGTLSSCSGVALHTTSKALAIFGSLKQRRNWMNQNLLLRSGMKLWSQRRIRLGKRNKTLKEAYTNYVTGGVWAELLPNGSLQHYTELLLDQMEVELTGGDI